MVESGKDKSATKRTKGAGIWFLALFLSFILTEKLVEKVMSFHNPFSNLLWLISPVLVIILHYNKTLWLFFGYVLLLIVRQGTGYDFTFNASLLMLLFLTAVRSVEIYESRKVIKI